MSRTAFEAWFSDDGKYPRACERSREGGYVLAHAADAWHAWQAAQADAYERAAKVCDELYDSGGTAYKIAARNQRDAERYRWLREHFRFANDSMRELWFDPALEPNDSSVPVDLDAEIDRAMSGANAGNKPPAAKRRRLE